MLSSMADTSETACANCGKAESERSKLKTCNACKLVKYCSRDCQVAHRPKHKKACKKRATELFEEDLFKDPPESEECPICMIPLPLDPSQSLFHDCCGKFLCMGCAYTKHKEDMRNGKQREEAGACAFCREPPSMTDKEVIDRLERGVERNDAPSMKQLGLRYRDGVDGLQKDLTKALVLFLKAGKLGDADAYNNVGNLYENGNGVEKDMKQARYYYELAAIDGSLIARHNLASLDWNSSNYSRACKHYLICAKGGFEPSLEGVKFGFKRGYVTKDEFTHALRACQKQHADTMSAMRDEAADFFTANPHLMN